MKTITKSQYYQVCGLLYLAQSSAKKIKELESAMADILNEENDNGYCGLISDATFEETRADDLLKKLKIKVE